MGGPPWCGRFWAKAQERCLDVDVETYDLERWYMVVVVCWTDLKTGMIEHLRSFAEATLCLNI